MASDYIQKLRKIFNIQEKVQDIHPFLEKLFPIALVENNCFLIYDTEPNSHRYSFVKTATLPMPMPQGVRAAFPLEGYNNRMCCVVTGDVFDELGGYVTIFHEFIHCQQAEVCEMKLKQSLGIAQKAQIANDFMWEINHPFPYSAPEFTRLYQIFLATQDMSEIRDIRKNLKSLLNGDDYEYMVWQEWKEGFARFIENKINQRLSLPENHGGKEQPLSRVVFYEGGAHYIQALSLQEDGLILQVDKLFDKMVNVGA